MIFSLRFENLKETHVQALFLLVLVNKLAYAPQETQRKCDNCCLLLHRLRKELLESRQRSQRLQILFINHIVQLVRIEVDGFLQG